MRELGSVSLLFRFITIQWRLCIVRCEALDSKRACIIMMGGLKELVKHSADHDYSFLFYKHTEAHTYNTDLD